MKSNRRCLFSLLSLVLLVIVGANPAYAKLWNVYPGPDAEATRAYIQTVINMAHDGDVIYFNRGTYDFSAAPASSGLDNIGALVILDKSLIVKGAPGSIIVGAPANIDPDTGQMTGIICFKVMNYDAKKDVVFDGLTLQTFFVGIDATRTNNDPNNFIEYMNLRNLTVNNCRLRDMQNVGIGSAGLQGNITITNNKVYGPGPSAGFGIYSEWMGMPGNMEWQPDNTLLTISNNCVAGFWAGIYTNRTSKMRIIGNAISNSSWGVMADWGSKNESIISYNTLSALDFGISVFSGMQLIDGVLVESPTRQITITHNNLITMRQLGIWFAGGISYSNLVAFNKVNLTSIGGWGFALYSEGHHEQFKNNTVTGYGSPPWALAIALGNMDYSNIGGPILGGNHELFMNNSVSGFFVEGPDYFLDPNSYDNRIIGIPYEHATYVDYGVNNTFEFVYPYDVSSSAKTALLSPNTLKAMKKPERPMMPRRIR